MARFKRFDAWRRCHDSPSPFMGLRAAFSAAANIAEGSAKRGSRELARYLDISLGSLAEVAYALIFARDIGIVSPGEYERLDSLQVTAETSTWYFYRSLQR